MVQTTVSSSHHFVLMAALSMASSSCKRPDKYSFPAQAQPSSAETAEAGDTGEDSGSGFLLHDISSCEDPLPSVRYSEVAAQMGLEGAAEPTGEHGHGGGLAIDDFDGDGDFDVVTTHNRSTVMLYRREADAFVVEILPMSNGFLPSLADLDGDGDSDLLISGHYLAPVLLSNDGAGQFTKHDLPTLISELDQLREFAVGDLDGDQVPDFYATVNKGAEITGGNDWVVRGLGNLGFEAVERMEPSGGPGRGFDSQWFDWDGDGDLDVYVVNDEGWDEGRNMLFENVSGVLREVTDQCACGLEMAGMGLDIGDYDSDGREDLYVTGTGYNVLLRALDDGSFVDMALSLNANPVNDHPDMAWGAVWLDYDNDGSRDILVAKGDLWYEEQEPRLDTFESPIVMLAQRDGRFVDESADLGLAEQGSWRSVVAFDDNGDGVLDLLVSHVQDRPHFYVSEGCTAAGWLEVEAPLGSKIEVTAGGQTQVGWASHDSSYGATFRLREHFGLGPTEVVDHLQVTLPTGEVRKLKTSFAARRVVTVVP